MLFFFPFCHYDEQRIHVGADKNSKSERVRKACILCVQRILDFWYSSFCLSLPLKSASCANDQWFVARRAKHVCKCVRLFLKHTSALSVKRAPLEPPSTLLCGFSLDSQPTNFHPGVRARCSAVCCAGEEAFIAFKRSFFLGCCSYFTSSRSGSRAATSRPVQCGWNEEFALQGETSASRRRTSGTPLRMVQEWTETRGECPVQFSLTRGRHQS